MVFSVIPIALSFVSVSVIKTLLPKTSLEEKGFIRFTIPGHSPS